MTNGIKVFFSRVRAWFSIKHVDEDFERELGEHLELLAAENIRRGMTPEEARRSARLRLGGTAQLRETNRELRGLPLLETILQDLRFGFRSLRKSPGFTAVAVLTLALGIGANTAIFTIVYGVLLRPLAFPQPERLVQLIEIYKEQPGEAGLTAAGLDKLKQYHQLFDFIAGYTAVGYNMAAGSGADHLRGMPVSADYFPLLGIPPMVGRGFTAEDDRGDGQHAAILSYGLWVRRFRGDSSIVGQKILLNGEPFTVIGVMPRDFRALGNERAPDPGATDLWTPLALVAKTAGVGQNISVLARLKPGVTRARLDAQMKIITKDFRAGDPETVGEEVALQFEPFQRVIGYGVRSYLLILLGSIGFVLLIACANIANLLLARGGLRRREMSMRIALGASRGRLFQQLLTECLLIAVIGGTLGLVTASLGLHSLLALAPLELPRASEIQLDHSAFAFTFLVSLLTGVVFGLIPAFDAARTSVADSLKEGAGRSSGARNSTRLRRVLIAGEFALSLVLLTGAGLMIATFSKLLRTDPGFNPHTVLTMQFWLGGSKYDSAGRIENFNRALLRRVESLPGVEAAGVVAAGLPLERGGNNGVRRAEQPESATFGADYREISPGYFRALGLALVQGRDFAETDSESSGRVAIVNEAFVKEHFPDRNPLGQNLVVGVGGGIPCEIVGIVGDVKSYLDEPAPSTVFVPAAQASYEISTLFEGWFPRTLVVRANVSPLSLGRSLSEAVAAVDPTIPVGLTRSMDQVLSKSLSLRGFLMILLSFFAGLALVLASIGIYGVISYTVSLRTREIGVRMALGAQPLDVLRQVLGEGLKLVLVGAVVGIVAALALTRLLTAFLYGVKPTDPGVFLFVVVLLVAVSLTACFLPALRAMRVDPVVALREE